MNRIKTFAIGRPFQFGLLLIVVFAILGTLTYPVHYLFPDTQVGVLFGDALAKLIIFGVLLFTLWRLAWLDASGLTSLGKTRFWIPIVLIFLYEVFTKVFAFTGDASLQIPRTPLQIGYLSVNLTTGLVEETLFRGLALVAMLKAWGATKQGQIKAILLSSVFFGLMHLVNILIRPFGVVLFQSAAVILSGIVYASMVLAFRTLWPSILIHWLANAAINIKLVGNPQYQETLIMWVLYTAFMIPLLIFAGYLVRNLPASHPIAEQAR